MNVLIPVKTKTLMGDITKELNVFFPGVNFRLSYRQEDTRTYITVRYTDGVSKTRVRNISRQFVHTYPCSGEIIKMYIEVERLMSNDTRNKLLLEMKSVWKVKRNLSLNEYFKPVGSTVKHYLQKIFDMRDFN